MGLILMLVKQDVTLLSYIYSTVYPAWPYYRGNPIPGDIRITPNDLAHKQMS